MPMYDFRCQYCGEVTDYYAKMADRFESKDCLSCGGADSAQLETGASRTTPATRVAGPTGPIVSERQVVDQYGKDWRDEGTNRRPGGAGAKTIFHG